MKPDWKDAPEWANYLVCDMNFCWWWAENKPEVSKVVDVWFFYGRSVRATQNQEWRSTMERRK